jgi:pimeloyl-ACP methyl ester carboxylesterase
MNFDGLWHHIFRRPYRLHAEVHGHPGKPAVILLHGIAASSDDWGKLVPLLTPKYQCITIDLLGFAKSPKPQWARYTMEDHVRSIAHTVSALHIDGKFILIGHSLGSLLATRYARKHTRQIEWLVLLSPPVYPPLASIGKRSAYYRTNWLLKLYRFLRTHPRMTPANMRRLSYIIPLPRSITTYPETWVSFHRSLESCIEQQTIERDIRDTKVPIDIFYGTLDALVVGHNVHKLAKQKDVQVHMFRGQHSISRAYAGHVAALLITHSKKSL